jgi:hypothetical protein
VRLGLSEGEKYPHWFIRTREEAVECYGEGWAREFFDPGFDVPDELAERWLTASALWSEAEEEIAAFLRGRQEEDGGEQVLVRSGQTGHGAFRDMALHLPRKDSQAA